MTSGTRHFTSRWLYTCPRTHLSLTAVLSVQASVTLTDPAIKALSPLLNVHKDQYVPSIDLRELGTYPSTTVSSTSNFPVARLNLKLAAAPSGASSGGVQA